MATHRSTERNAPDGVFRCRKADVNHPNLVAQEAGTLDVAHILVGRQDGFHQEIDALLDARRNLCVDFDRARSAAPPAAGSASRSCLVRTPEFRLTNSILKAARTTPASISVDFPAPLAPATIQNRGIYVSLMRVSSRPSATIRSCRQLPQSAHPVDVRPVYLGHDRLRQSSAVGLPNGSSHGVRKSRGQCVANLVKARRFGISGSGDCTRI